MPLVDFDDDTIKVESPYEYPKLYLDKNERARVLAIERQPLMEYVHTLRAPQIVNGKVVMEEARRRDGTTYEEVSYDFIGRHLCLGDNNVLADKGLDPANCPSCHAASESDAVEDPTRRYAIHLIRYATKSGSFEVADPYQVSLLGWAFTDKTFRILRDIMKEWGPLKEHDLLLGPCEVKQYQKYDIKPSQKAEWLADGPKGERAKLTVRTYQENKAKDLTVLIGRKLTESLIEDDIAKVLSRHAAAFGGSAPPSEESVAETVSLDVSEILGDDGEFAGESVESVEVADTEAPAAATTVEDDSLDFDKLMEEL